MIFELVSAVNPSSILKPYFLLMRIPGEVLSCSLLNVSNPV